MNIFATALKMELDGEQFYKEQAAKNSGNNLESVFAVLAKTEKKHAKLIEKRMQGKEISEQEIDLQAGEHVFSGLEDYKTGVLSVPKQLDVYRFALDIEKKSIDHYQGMLAQAEEDQDKDLLNFLIAQEKDHYKLFEQLVEMVKRPEDWVENAEFGNREEY